MQDVVIHSLVDVPRRRPPQFDLPVEFQRRGPFLILLLKLQNVVYLFNLAYTR